MSAIFGLVQFDGQAVDAANLTRMGTALLAHGPDGGGQWHDNMAGIGQRLLQLTPQDRSERQPLLSADGHFCVVVNGRLDSRPEIHALCDVDALLENVTDSELILEAYARWGKACVGRLVGAFTFALWDRRAQELLVVRSGGSSPSLFYCADSNRLAFSTMPKGLFALPGLPRQIDEQYLAESLAVIGGEPEACFYRGVTRLLPGQMLVVQRDRWSVHSFWGDAPPKDEIRFSRDEEYVEAFEAILQRVIQDYLRCISPVGVMMSGGLDSTTVAAIAAPLYAEKGRRLITFTEVPRLGFDGAIIAGRYADETPYVEAMARRYESLDPNFIRTDGRVYTEELDTFFAAAEAPLPNASNRMWYETILRAAQSRGVRLLLTGASGNLTVSWNGSGLLAQLVGNGQWSAVAREVQTMVRRTGTLSALKVLLRQGIMPHLPDAAYLALERLQTRNPDRLGSHTEWRWRSPIRAEFAKTHGIDELFHARARHLHFRTSADTASRRLRSLISQTRRGDGIAEGYQALYGVYTGDPTGDARLVDFCLSLPESQYQREGISRWLIRRAMAHRLPPEVLHNQRRGLQAADWYERLSGGRAALLDELTRIERCDLAQQALDLPLLRRLIMQLGEDGSNRAGHQLEQYRGVLERGLMTGSFIRWAAGE